MFGLGEIEAGVDRELRAVAGARALVDPRGWREGAFDFGQGRGVCVWVDKVQPTVELDGLVAACEAM